MVATDSEDEGRVYYFPPPRGFEDTGFVESRFTSGSSIKVRVVPSQDYSEGADIEIIIKDGNGKTCCDVIMEKFSALCLANAIIKNLVNQEELVYDATREQIRRANEER